MRFARKGSPQGSEEHRLTDTVLAARICQSIAQDFFAPPVPDLVEFTPDGRPDASSAQARVCNGRALPGPSAVKS